MKSFTFAGAAAIVLVAAATSHAALSLSLTGPATQNYANGGGNGFGGTLGAATISMGSSGGNLDVNFLPGGGLNDLVVIRFDTRNGGVGDAEMNDQADGGRRASSSPIRDGFLNEPAGMTTYTAGSGGGVSDFALVIGNFGVVLFELTSGTNLNFVSFNPGTSVSIPLATLGSPGTVDWFAYYTSDSTFLSNESMPASAALNGAGNPGFGPGTFSVDNFNRFLVPAPGAAALLGLGGLAALRRRRN
jgi:hypothetical protein